MLMRTYRRTWLCRLQSSEVGHDGERKGAALQLFLFPFNSLSKRLIWCYVPSFIGEQLLSE